MEKNIKIYHVETQEDYDDLMIELENEGYLWCSGKSPTSLPENTWSKYGDGFCLIIGETMSYSSISWCECNYKDIPIIKHKAKGVEKMEKVVVPQFVADWYEENKNSYILGAILDKLEKTKDENIVNWRGSCYGRHKNNFGNAQEVIAKMHIYGYEVEEKEYYWRKKKEYFLEFETVTYAYLNHGYITGSLFFASLTQNENHKTTFTETEIKELVSEEDFNKLERVEIDE